jgi:hypothetical protein
MRELSIIDERGSSSRNEWGSMMNTHAIRLWGAALLTLSPGCLIDRFLDWVEDMSAVLLPAHVNTLAVREVPIETRRGPFSA